MTSAAIVLLVLESCCLTRLHKAVEGLSNGEMTCQITRITESEIRALVTNGEGDYGVMLGDGYSSCSCKDSLYRGTNCKHILLTAVCVLRSPKEVAEPTYTTAPMVNPSDDDTDSPALIPAPLPNLKLAKVRRSS